MYCRYAEENGDRLHMESFYDNYCNPSPVHGSRNYPVICVNYHKMWDNKQALVAALGLPAEEASKVGVGSSRVCFLESGWAMDAHAVEFG